MATASSTSLALAPKGFVSHLPVELASKAAFTTFSLFPSFKNSASRLVCLAASPKETQNPAGAASNVVAAVALAALMSSAPLVAPEGAFADVAGLTPCKESKAFAKREKQEIKKLESRLKLYEPDSAPALAINATIEKTKRRFSFYGNAGLLCGTDGLPHLIVDGDQKHLGEFVYPGIVFLYIAGWIGWVGRSYLIEVKASAKKPTEKEIIIDVPLATRLLWRGFTWPLAAVSEFRNGKLIEDAANITVSPR
ncbi:hypothetical protein O6H91_14G019100 [Diphasiastrum complanatum]|uniref:Uncharacterized protein n=2 Tax=Diphasiastrum complanatum TaxID=34168 RepID=A0ACC2BLZ1_DIPCM|nr:hypothetical protein O6H91_14G018900 [Diphasiastrum complanatum]KAJ7530788.1 hypothetical protein O6H91_14G019100 [Diphasiastrum complanatum]